MSEHHNGRALLRTPQRNLKEQMNDCQQTKQRKLAIRNSSKQLSNLQAIYQCALSLLEEKQEKKELAVAKLLALQAEHDFKVALANVRMSRQAVNAGTVYIIHITNQSGNQNSFSISSDAPVFSGSSDPGKVIINSIWTRDVAPHGGNSVYKTNIQYYAYVETRDTDSMPGPGDSSDGEYQYKAVDLQDVKKPSTNSATTLTWDPVTLALGLTDPVHPAPSDNLADGAFRISTPDNYVNLLVNSKKSRVFEPTSVLIIAVGVAVGLIYQAINAKKAKLSVDLLNFNFDFVLEKPEDMLEDEKVDNGVSVRIVTKPGFVLSTQEVCDLILDSILTEAVFKAGTTVQVVPNTKAKYAVKNRFSAVLDDPAAQHFNVGLGLSNDDPNNPVIMASYVNGPPKAYIDITPVTKFYVMMGKAEVGTAIDTKIWSDAALIDFTTQGSHRTAYITYQATGDWSTPTFE